MGLDRTGLLYDLTREISDLNLTIGSAHIGTYGEKAVDVFYVTDLTGHKIDGKRAEAIHDTLLRVFQPTAEAKVAMGDRWRLAPPRIPEGEGLRRPRRERSTSRGTGRERVGGLTLYRNFLSVGGLTLLSRVVGFARDALMAAVLGAGPAADAFYAAFRFPNLFRRLFAEGAFNTAFVPMFSGALEQKGAEPGARSRGAA